VNILFLLFSSKIIANSKNEKGEYQTDIRPFLVYQ